LEVLKQEAVRYDDQGVEAIIFTADGDMRQALNNLQSTHAGFGLVSADNVFRVCDQPHPRVLIAMMESALEGDIDESHKMLQSLWSEGYSASDLISTLFRVVKGMPIPEQRKLEALKEIGLTHMRIVNGLGSLLQLSALLARLCQIKDRTPAK
jgi:replication factor C subunit 2/4